MGKTASKSAQEKSTPESTDVEWYQPDDSTEAQHKPVYRNQQDLSSPPESEIFLIRGEKVMLDTDVAALYEVDTKVLIQMMRRYVERFPVDFVFRLTPQEFDLLKDKLDDPKDFERNKSTPYAFTEEGIVMASHFLRSPRAIQVSNTVVQDFVRMRKICGTNMDVAEKLEDIEEKYDQKFQQIYSAIKNLESHAQPPAAKQVGFRIS